MELKRFLKSISIKTKYLNPLLLIIVFSILLFISGCSKKEYPNPTDEFYVNDFAQAFHPVTKNAITIEGESLYADTKHIETIGGVQIVFATFTIENLDDIAKYNRTDIFRQWKIGKNDMGVLILMFFSEGEDNYIYLEETQIEVGYRMEQYLTAGKQGRLLDNTIYNNTYDNLDMRVAHLLYELLTIVYEEIYGEYYDSFTYDMEDFRDALTNYVPEEDNIDIGLWAWLILFFTGTDGLWFLIVPLGILFVFGGIKFKNHGGGGSSGGFGIFRRR